MIIPGECLVLAGSACPSSCLDYLSTPEICKKEKTPSLSRGRTLTSKNVDLSDRSINSHLISNQVTSTSLSIYHWSKEGSNIKILWSFVIANRKPLSFLLVSPSRAVEFSGQVEKPTDIAYFNVPCHAQNLETIVYCIPELEVNTTYSYWRSRDGAAMRALASHQCVLGSIPGPRVICGLSLLLVLVPAPKVFLRVLQFSSLLKNQHF